MDHPPTEGALAAKPAPVTPQIKTEPLRQIPALRGKEKPGWREEVRERVRKRRRRRDEASGALPLFGEEPRGEGKPEDAPPDAHAALPREEELRSVHRPELAPEEERDAAQDLPLHPPDEEAESASETHEQDGVDGIFSSGEEPSGEEADEWSLGGGPLPEPRPVERPAYLGERTRAAVIDLALFLLTATVVVYFASRAARVSLVGLKPTWPYLVGYLGSLGLWYAGYFTGVTGQTLGKLTTGLKVVDRHGAPPGYLRAFLRAALGAIGIAAAFAGLAPMLFDPARRAFHDRVFKTRVIRG